jgi:hypothetical protein
VNKEIVDKIVSDYERFRRFVREEKPNQRVINLPIDPLSLDQSVIKNDMFKEMGSRVNVLPMELKALIIYGFQNYHADEVIDNALKQFLIAVKMRLPENSNLIEGVRTQEEFYQRDLVATKKQQDDEAEKFRKAMIVYNLNRQKKLNEFHEYTDRILKEAIDAFNEEKVSVWQKLTIEELRSSFRYEELYECEIEFNGWSIDSKKSFFENIAIRHREWVRSEFLKVWDEIYYKLLEETPCEVDAETFLAYFDEHGDPIGDAWDRYDIAMNDWDADVRWNAEKQARKVFQQRVKEQIDGYTGPTYGYDQDL